MAYVQRYRLPRMIVRGVTQTLSMDIYTDAGVQQTPSAATLTLYSGGETILDAVAATAAAPSTYSLTGATTTSEDLSDDWMEVWSLTLGGVAYEFSRPAYLVRRDLYPTITDTDLIEYHTDIADILDPDETTLEKQRVAAWTEIQLALISRGRRPELILDPFALRMSHIYKSLELFFRDAAMSAPGGRYQELASQYADLYREEWSQVNFRYDSDEDGVVDDERVSAPGVVFLSAPKRI